MQGPLASGDVRKETTSSVRDQGRRWLSRLEDKASWSRTAVDNGIRRTMAVVFTTEDIQVIYLSREHARPLEALKEATELSVRD